MQRESTEETKEKKKESEYRVDIRLEGGSGKAYILSPVTVRVTDGEMIAELVWSSKNYDYMIVNGERYDNENPGGNSTFHVIVPDTETPLTVIGDTVAMSTPHEITYTIYWGNAAVVEEDEEEILTGSGAAGSMTDPDGVEKALRDSGLTKTGEMALGYAEGFRILEYGDYRYITIRNSGDYLLVPEQGTVPDALPEEVTIIQKPLDRAYLVSTSAMDPVVKCGALDRIRLSGTRESDWFIEEAAEEMKKKNILYAGKYRAPDYELILKEGCDLAIENTMIYHEPAVMEKLRECGIPVLVETSSYESHPLGRLEWIRLYGVLFDREAEADAYFEEQLRSLRPFLKEKKDTGKTVAFFHVTAGGLVNVRRSGDYITEMITLAGGHYVPDRTGDAGSNLSSMNMQMEDFYAQVSEADIMIYNSTIGGEITSVEELIDKDPLFADFKAVKEGRVYCTERNFFQQTTGVAEFMLDLDKVLRDDDTGLTYLKRLE